MSAPALHESATLRPLAALAAQSFDSTAEATEAILATLSAQLGLRTTFLTRISVAEGRNQIVAAYNAAGGSDIAGGSELSLDDTFCGIIAAADERTPLLIPDTRRDPVHGKHPAVIASPTIGSFIGVPLLLADGTLFGTLCAVDPDPQPLDAAQADLLIVLSRLLATHLERDQQGATRVVAEQERDTLLAALAHDLKTPLTAARGLAQLLLRGAERGNPPTAEALAQRLAQIVVATDRATALVDEQLDLARAQYDRPLALAPRPVDLVALVRRIVAEQAPLAAAHHFRVVTALPDLFVPVDVPQLDRVLTNLLSNAVKYSPAGGDVALTLTLDDATPGAARWAMLAVSDTGIGIPATDLPHIGEPFRRGANALGQIAGTGLGLASARQIVEAHGGTVAIASVEGAGTVVTIRLPLPGAAV